MPQITFAQFEAAAGPAQDERLIKQGGNSVRARMGMRGQAQALFGHGTLMSTQNDRVIEDFKQAMESRYGEAGKAAFQLEMQQRENRSRSLRPEDVQRTINRAQNMVPDMVNAGIMQPHEDEVRAAMQHVQLPEGQRGEMLRREIFDALLRIQPQFGTIDRSNDHQALAQLGTRLAAELDQKYLMTALGTRLSGPPDRTNESYSQLMREFVGQHPSAPAAFQDMLDHNPAMERAVRTEVDQFVHNMNSLSTRMRVDMGQINTDFAGTRPVGAGAATGITGIHVTSSDPHHGGNRVCILTLDNNQKLVYKPRDVRIDAALVGHQGAVADNPALPNDNNRSLVEIGNSLLQAGGGGQPLLPTMQFLPRQDLGMAGNAGRYGYVQCLSNGTEQDNVVDNAGAQRLHHQLGQLTALMLVAGVRDLHQTNMMISGGQPFMTDVEIAFDQDLLQTIGQDFQHGAAMPPVGAAPQSIVASQMSAMWSSGTESVRQDTLFDVVGDRIVKPHGNNRNVTEGVTENMLVVNGIGGVVANRNLGPNNLPNAHSQYAGQVADGFKDMMNAIAANAVSLQRVENFIDTTDGLHVRYHPIATGEQLRVLQNTRLDTIGQNPLVANTDHVITGQCQANVNAKQLQINGRAPHLQVPIATTQNAMIQDLQRGDVPYFTRELGDNKVFHNGTDPITTNPLGANPAAQQQFFASNPLDMAKQNVQSLAVANNLNHVVTTFADSLQNYVAGLPMPILIGQERQDFAQKVGPQISQRLGAPVGMHVAHGGGHAAGGHGLGAGP